MNWIIERRLRKLGHRAQPDAAFARALRKEINAEIGSSSIFGWAQWHRGLAWASGSTAAFVLAVSGTGVYAYQSDAITPNHVLYPVRIVAEHVVELAAITPHQRVNARMKKLQHRLREQEILQNANQLTPARVQEFENHVDEVMQTVADMPSKETEIVQEEVRHMEQKHVKILQKARETATEEMKKTIDDELQGQQDRQIKREQLFELKVAPKRELMKPVFFRANEHSNRKSP